MKFLFPQIADQTVLHCSLHMEQTPDTLKRLNSLNTFKYNFKGYYLKNSYSV